MQLVPLPDSPTVIQVPVSQVPITQAPITQAPNAIITSPETRQTPGTSVNNNEVSTAMKLTATMGITTLCLFLL